ncbi:MFS transporter [Streptomyces piniterrae]|uniref:MFS transporter n=1 Tax=Streptomyces piniterrae TaxID=2571125 RepID=A0A4U0NJ05_9ACTN|nr:MFS transporter [Streptomyces piniterrae]TJZ54160.1 MFS transporter [Streptomyces piniterrae]
MSTETPHTSFPRQLAGPREWLGLAVLALPTLLLAMDATVLYLAVPHLSVALQPGGSELLWIADIYGFMIAGFLVTMGTLGDRIGRRKLLMVGAAAFGVASALAAYSTSPQMLIAARALLGMAGATLMPSTLALITNMFRDPKQRGTAIGVWVTCFSAGVALGPVLGGLLLQAFWWGSVFLLGVPVMILLLVTAPVLLPEYRDNQAGRLDPASVVLSLAAILPIIYGIKELAKDGFAALPVSTLIGGLIVGVLFVHRQSRLASPLLDVALFRNRSFSAALGIQLLSIAALGGVYLFITQYTQLVEGLSPLKAGLWLLPAAGALILASALTPALARKMPAAYVIGASLAISASGYLVLTQVDSVSGLPVLVTGFILVYLGISPMFVLGTDLIVGAAPPEKAGSAASMSETSTEFGVALGVAILGTVGTALYRDRMTVPVGVPAPQAESARESLADAMATVNGLPDRLHDILLDSARAAFTDGLNVVSGISAALVAAMAVLAVSLLPRTRPDHATTEPSAVTDPETTAVSTGTTEAGATKTAAGITNIAIAESPPQ